jgi:hypothetical protein
VKQDNLTDEQRLFYAYVALIMPQLDSVIETLGDDTGKIAPAKIPMFVSALIYCAAFLPASASPSEEAFVNFMVKMQQGVVPTMFNLAWSDLHKFKVP